MSTQVDKTAAIVQAKGYRDATGGTLYPYRCGSASISAGVNSITHGLATGLYCAVTLQATGLTGAIAALVSGTVIDIMTTTACTVDWVVFGNT